MANDRSRPRNFLKTNPISRKCIIFAENSSKMKHFKLILLLFLCTLFLGSCASMKAPIVQRYESLEQYKYIYITPTAELTSSSGGVYGNQFGVYGGSQTKTINPSDVISGVLIKRGYIRLPELNPNLADQTLIVNYGESGRRNVNLGYSIEVTIQFLSARTNTPICICTAEGQGSTEADDVRIAITRALEALFK